MYLIVQPAGSLLEFTSTASKSKTSIRSMLSAQILRNGACIALAANLSILQNLSALAQELPPDTVKRSLAVAMPTPKSIPQNHQSTRNKSAAYSRNALKAKARAGYPRTHLEKGFYLKQKKDLNGALIEFLNATQENPHLVKGFYEQALIFRERGYRKLAESSLEQALASKPDYNEARVLLATVLYRSFRKVSG